MDRKQIKTDRIAERVFESQLRTANFRLDYERMFVNEDGFYAEIDGYLDYADIEKSFQNASTKLQNSAEQLAQTLVKGDFKNEKGEKIFKVDKINSNDFRIVHDEDEERIYLFLPKRCYDKPLEMEKSDELKESIDKLLSWLRDTSNNDTVNSHEPLIIGEDRDDIRYVAIPLNIQEGIKKPNENGNILTRLTYYKTIGKRNDKFTLSLMLTIFQKGTKIFEKLHEKIFEFKNYGLENCTKDKQYMLFPFTGDSATAQGIVRKAEKLGEDIHNSKNAMLKEFIKDLENFKTELKEKKS